MSFDYLETIWINQSSFLFCNLTTIKQTLSVTPFQETETPVVHVPTIKCKKKKVQKNYLKYYRKVLSFTNFFFFFSSLEKFIIAIWPLGGTSAYMPDLPQQIHVACDNHSSHSTANSWHYTSSIYVTVFARLLKFIIKNWLCKIFLKFFIVIFFYLPFLGIWNCIK